MKINLIVNKGSIEFCIELLQKNLEWQEKNPFINLNAMGAMRKHINNGITTLRAFLPEYSDRGATPTYSPTEEEIEWMNSYSKIIFIKNKKSGNLSYIHPGSLFNQWDDYYLFNPIIERWEDKSHE